MAPNLLKKASQAVALNAVGNWTTMICTFLSIIVVARILTPADYGVFVIAITVLSLPEVIASGTLGDALVQRKDLRPGHINSVFLQSILIAIVFWLVLILTAPFIADAFDAPAVAPVLIVAGVILPIGALMSVPSALLQRDLRYKEITVVDIMGTVTAAIAGIVLALWWRNEWALLGMELSRRFIRLAGFLYFARWLPQAESRWPDFHELFRFNLANGTSRILQKLDAALPKALIGGALGPHAVGVFNLPERLFAQTNSALIAPFAAVAMPVASAMQDSREALHRAMENAIRMSSLMAFPTFVGAFVIAPYAIPLLFGEKWAESVPIFQVFMIIGLRSPITAIISGVFRGVGRPDIVVWVTFTSITTTIVLLMGVYQYGLLAIAIALLCKQIVTFFLSVWLIQRVVKLSVISQLTAAAPAFFSSVIMGVVVWIFLGLMPANSNALLSLTSAIALGGLTYPVMLYAFMPSIGRVVLRALGVLLSGKPREALQFLRRALSERDALISTENLKTANSCT